MNTDIQPTDGQTVRRVALVTLCFLLTFGVLVGTASAHAYLGESDPANGAQLESVPDEVTLTFTGDGIQVADIEIVGPDGDDVSGEAEIDPDDSQVVTAPLEDDGEGMYLVQWEVLADDGHTTSGTFFFVVGDEPVDRETILDAHDSEIDDSISWFEAGGKGLLVVGLVGVIGLPIVALVAVRPVLGRDSDALESATATFDDRLRLVLSGLGGVLFVGVLAVGLAQTRSLGSLSVGTTGEFVGTPLGEVWLGQLAVALALLGILFLAPRRLPTRTWATATAVGGLLVALGVAWTSHSATAIDRLQGVTVDFLHLLGASLWVGGLLVLVLWLTTARREVDPGERARVTASVVRRFSVLAIGGVTLLVATGILLADWHVTTSEGLTETQYGWLLVGKLVLVSIALALGAYNRFVLLGRLEARSSGLLGSLLGRPPVRQDGGTAGTVTQFGRSVRIELGVLVVVLLLSGVLTSAATAAVVVADEESGIEAATFESEFTDEVTVEFTAFPTQHDGSFMVDEDEIVVFEVAFERDGDSLQADGPVELLATTDDGQTTFEVELDEDGEFYTTAQAFPAAGNWDLRVTGTVADSFGSAWFDGYVMADMGHVHGDSSQSDHEDHTDHAVGHSHEEGSTSTPAVLVTLLVVIYGLLGVIYETHALSQRDQE